MPYLKYIFLFAWMLIIFSLSHEPASESSVRSAVIVDSVSGVLPLAEEFLTFLVRKSAHIVAYFVLGILMYNVVLGYKLKVKTMILLSIVGVLAYAAFDETHQLFIPGRSGEVRDVLLDTAAGTVGVFTYYWLFRRYKNYRESKSNPTSKK